MVSGVPKMIVLSNFVTKSKLKASLTVWENLLPYIFQGGLQTGSPSRRAAPGFAELHSIFGLLQLSSALLHCDADAVWTYLG